MHTNYNAKWVKHKSMIRKLRWLDQSEKLKMGSQEIIPDNFIIRIINQDSQVCVIIWKA